MRILITVLLLLAPVPGVSDQFLIPNARESRVLFWEKLYPSDSYTLYCGEYFDTRDEVTIEYIYPLGVIANYLQCADIEECRDTSGRFNRIEADLHNQYPALNFIVHARNDYDYGLVAGEYREFFECDFEHDVRDRIVEPRTVARGNVARAMLYMHTEYDLPITPEMLSLFKEWNRTDAPSKDEIRRNNIIDKLQGTRNPYIDTPAKANKIRPAISPQANNADLTSTGYF